MFFKSDATKRQKIAGTVIYALLPLIFIGMFSDTLIYSWYFDAFIYPVLATSLVLVAIVLYMMLFKFREETQANLARTNQKMWVVIIGVVIFIPMFLYAAFLKGVPVLLHSFISSESEVYITVRKKSYRYSEKHCRNGGVFIEGYTYFLNDKLCGFNESDWESITSGDRLRLDGKVSKFGFTLKKYQKLKK